MSVGDEFGKSERPIDPANTRSPERTNASVPKQQWPGVCPGVCRTSMRKPANSSTSPPAMVRRSFTSARGFAKPGFQRVGIGERHRVRLVHVDRHVVAREAAGGLRVVQVGVREQNRSARRFPAPSKQRRTCLRLEPRDRPPRRRRCRRPRAANSSCRTGSGRRRRAT